MANFTTTCLNTLNVFGRSDQWNDYNWNAFIWGDGTADLPIRFIKVIDNSIAPDTTIPIKITIKVIDNAITPTSDMVKYAIKVVDNSLTPTSDMVKYAVKVIDNALPVDSDSVRYYVKVIDNSITPDNDIVKTYVVVIDNTIDTDIDMYLESLQEPNGWYYVFPGDATNIENRVRATYISGTTSASGWLSLTAGNGTSWS